MKKIVWQDEVGCKRVCMALGVERIILGVLDVLAAAEQDAAFVMMPMAEFVADREASTAPGCCGC